VKDSVIWVAIEATTVATAFLVGHRRTRAALEATWKYVVICSVGIALAFLGTILLYFASLYAGASSGNALDISWPADHTGWRLEGQTNAVNVGLSNNWVTVAGSKTCWPVRIRPST